MGGRTSLLVGALAALLLLSRASATLADAPEARMRQLFPFAEGGKWGYCNARGEVAISPRFARAHDFRNGRALINTESGAFSFIDEQGKIVFALRKGEGARDFAGELAGFSAEDKRGYRDRDGKVVVGPKYDNAYDFSEGLAAVNLGAKMLDFPRRIPHGGKWGFIDQTGRLVIPVHFDDVDVSGFSEGLALVSVGEQQAYIDRTGKIVIRLDSRRDNPKAWVEGASAFSEGLARVYLSGSSAADAGTWFIDKTGKVVLKRKGGAGKFSQGLAAAEVVGKGWGYMDHTGRLPISPQFDEAGAFAEGLAAVRRGKAWSYINQQGQVLIPGPFNDVEPFSGGLARVHVGGTFVIANDGPAIWQGGAWYYVNPKGERVRRCCDDGKWGHGYGKEIP